MTDSLTEEIAASAARLVVETGLEYGAAKHKAARALGRRGGGLDRQAGGQGSSTAPMRAAMVAPREIT